MELAEEGAAGVLRASGLHRAVRRQAVSEDWGLGAPNVHQWREIMAAVELTCDGAPVKFRHSRGPMLEMVALGSFLGPRRSCGGELQGLGRSVAAWPRRSSSSAPAARRGVAC